MWNLENLALDINSCFDALGVYNLTKELCVRYYYF
jgi:hypothetical protein